MAIPILGGLLLAGGGYLAGRGGSGKLFEEILTTKKLNLTSTQTTSNLLNVYAPQYTYSPQTSKNISLTYTNILNSPYARAGIETIQPSSQEVRPTSTITPSTSQIPQIIALPTQGGGGIAPSGSKFQFPDPLTLLLLTGGFGAIYYFFIKKKK